MHMKRKLITGAFIIISMVILAQNHEIRINSLGYLPGSSKKATIIKECSRYQVVSVKNNKVVYKGVVKGPFYQSDVNQHAWIADFSNLKTNGTYFIKVPGVGKSIEFKISDTVYDQPFYTVFRSLYLFRCGTDLEAEYHGNIFRQKACHLQDGYTDYIGLKDGHMDATGGWHDAGDYGKYTTNAAFSLGILFMAWDHFKNKLEKFEFDLPETAPGFPEYLEELKWETDWLLKMQYPDGSGRVSDKLTRLNFEGFIPPDKDDGKRYFSEWSSTAIADFVASMAAAARYFKEYDPNYAETCLNAAVNSYRYLKKNSEYKRMEQTEFHTGAYESTDDDDRMWAAAELWETTGQFTYLADLEERLKQYINISTNDWDWPYVAPLGIFTYLSSVKEGKNPELVRSFREKLLADADSLVSFINKDVYGRSHDRYYWGTNGLLPRLVINLHMAWNLSADKKYVRASQDIIAHIFGRNYYNRSFVTGVGLNPPMNPHDRRSGSDNLTDPWPGYIVGGGHTATDWVDEQDNFSRNEIALNWQASLIYALAAFIDYQEW